MKKSLLFLTGLCFSTAVWGAEWIDVTKNYVVNPGFTANSNSGWTITTPGKVDTQFECLEFFSTTFNISQTIKNLPNGKYRVGVHGFYRNGYPSMSYYESYVNGYYANTAYLYANSAETLMPSIYEQTSNYGFGGTVLSYSPFVLVPNSMQDASNYFAYGFYPKTLEVNVTNGSLTMGVKNETYVGGNWCIMTDWTLEYYTEVITLSSLKFQESEIKMGPYETRTITPVLTPEPSLSLVYDLKWSSNNSAVAMVNQNGEVTALKNGTATITCRDARTGLSASFKLTVVSTPLSSQNVVINEIESANIDQFIDPSGNYGGWVELYNPTDTPANLGNGFVRDSKGHSFRLPYNYGSIPAKGFMTLWFDHCDRYNEYRQVAFKLDVKGGTIQICDAQGSLVAQQDYPATIHRASYARKQDGGSEWAYTGTPTPNASNAGSIWGTEQLAAPVVDTDGRFFTGSLTIKVTVPAGTLLKYTTDGSTPTASNGTSYRNGSTSALTKSFTINNTTVYRFCLLQDGKLPSEVVTRSYLKNTGAYKVPVVSVVANDRDIYGPEYGLYVKGSGNGRPGRGQADPCNWNMDWERAVNFEYMVPDASGTYSSVVFNQLVDMEMCGGWSRAWEPHSFKLKANKIYGENNLDYPFFDSKPFNRHKSLQLRNGGNDSYTGHRFKDAALQEVIRRSGLYVDGQAWQPVHVFINGVYKKMLGMREPNNRHNAFSNYGIDTDFIDQFEMSPDSGYIQMSGSRESFDLLIEKSKKCADDATYQFICDSLLDMDAYVNYMSVLFYLGGSDWPQNNVKGFRAVQDDENGHPVGKYHFVIFDLDHAFDLSTNVFSNFNDKETYTFDALYGIDEDGNDVTGQHYTRKIEFVSLFKNLLKNEKFKKKFADTFCLVAGSVFDPERCRSVIRELQAYQNTAMAAEGGNCNGRADYLIENLSSSRQTTMTTLLRTVSQFGMTGGRKLSVSSNVDGAQLLMNDMEVPTGRFSGTWYGDAKVRALAPAGYRFVGWSNGPGNYAEANVFSRGSEWYYVQGKSLDNDPSWKNGLNSSSKGNAPLGFGKTVNTTLNSGNLTYYFGKTFNLTSDMLVGDLTLNMTVDDGCVVYVNGVEAGRYLMPSGTVNSNTTASTYANDNPDNTTMVLSKSLFKTGTNTLCVEVHNHSTTSSDIYWDAELLCTKSAQPMDFVSKDSVYTFGTSSATIVACYEPIATAPIRVNEVGAANDVYVNEYWKKNDWIELYNASEMDLDVAGLYVSDNTEKPTKYQIAANNFADATIIPAGGKRVLWADKLESDQQIHTGFKLNNESGAYVLVCSSELFETNNARYFEAHPGMKGFADILTYDIQEYNQSVGRYPDGSNAIFRMKRPSIGNQNRHLPADDFLWYDQGIRIDTGSSAIEEVEQEKVVVSWTELLEQGVVFYDLSGKRVVRPQAGQLILRGKSSK